MRAFSIKLGVLSSSNYIRSSLLLPITEENRECTGQRTHKGFCYVLLKSEKRKFSLKCCPSGRLRELKNKGEGAPLKGENQSVIRKRSRSLTVAVAHESGCKETVLMYKSCTPP